MGLGEFDEYTAEFEARSSSVNGLTRSRSVVAGKTRKNRSSGGKR